MALTPIPIGSLAWGTPLNNQIQDLDQRLIALRLSMTSAATDQGYIAWNFDPATNLAVSAMTSGTIFMSKLWVREDSTITNVVASVNTASTGGVVGQNFAGLYDGAGTRIGVTTDQTANWASVGNKIMALTAPVPVVAGAYYVALLVNATTPLSFARGSALSGGPTTVNANLTATNARFATGPTAQTTLPVSITMGARTADARAVYVAVS